MMGSPSRLVLSVVLTAWSFGRGLLPTWPEDSGRHRSPTYLSPSYLVGGGVNAPHPKCIIIGQCIVESRLQVQLTGLLVLVYLKVILQIT